MALVDLVPFLIVMVAALGMAVYMLHSANKNLESAVHNLEEALKIYKQIKAIDEETIADLQASRDMSNQTIIRLMKLVGISMAEPKRVIN